ncbi:MAG: hypothetical protein WC568_03700 [Candidatus Methanoperedens sp.]
MSKNRIILVIKASDIDVSSLPEDKRATKAESRGLPPALKGARKSECAPTHA